MVAESNWTLPVHSSLYSKVVSNYVGGEGAYDDDDDDDDDDVDDIDNNVHDDDEVGTYKRTN